MLFPAQKTTLALAIAAQYSSSPFLMVGQLLLKMTNLASPDLKALKVDLYPKTNFPLFITKASLLLMFSLVFFLTIFVGYRIIIINQKLISHFFTLLNSIPTSHLQMFALLQFLSFLPTINFFQFSNKNSIMTNSDSMQWQRNEKRTKNFECPCGKSYLSYPALYTHIKQSHGGKAPGQIKRPDTHNRGRPKATGNARIQEHNKIIEDNLKTDPIPDLLKLVGKQTVSQNRQIQQIYLNEPVYRLIMNDKQKPFTPHFLKQDRIYDVRMGEGIIQFFRELDERISNKNIYDEIVMLIVLLTEHIIEETEDQNVLNLGTIGLMSQFVNYFMIHDFRKPVERLKIQKAWIFQDQNAIQVLNIFFKWMLYKRFTLTKVEINLKYLNPNGSESDNDQEDSESNSNDDQSEDEDRDRQENNKSSINDQEIQSPNDQSESLQQKGQINLNPSKKIQDLEEKVSEQKPLHTDEVK